MSDFDLKEIAKLREENERLQVQLAGCGVAATGWATGKNRAHHGDYGWSPAFEDVLKLREKSWRCWHCDFFTLDKKAAAAHFGDRDDADEFKPLCKWFDRTPIAEQAFIAQGLAEQLNEEVESHMRTIDEREVWLSRATELSESLRKLLDTLPQDVMVANEDECNEAWIAARMCLEGIGPQDIVRNSSANHGPTGGDCLRTGECPCTGFEEAV